MKTPLTPGMPRHAVTAAATLATLTLFATVDCSGSGAPPPNAYLTSTLGASPTGASTCSISNPGAPFIEIGSAGAPVSTDGTYNGDAITVSCAVHSTAGEAFTFSVQIADNVIGNITLLGSVTYAAATVTTPQMTVTTATFSSQHGGSYINNDATGKPVPCSVTLTSITTPPITSGRMWATVTCPTLVNATANSTCEGTATFLVQNCGQ